MAIEHSLFQEQSLMDNAISAYAIAFELDQLTIKITTIPV